MEERQITQLLKQVRTIDDAYKIVRQNTGEDFNVFSILGMETSEVKTHSKFLTELLNPKGSHLQGDVFLQIFIAYLNNLNDDNENLFLSDKINLISEKSKVQVEKYIGQKTETEGGRVDISIEDTNKNVIFIENKIYAGEQEGQMLRYFNHGQKYTKCHLLFLTLNGEECASLPKKVGTAYCISYKKHIIEWLELCKKEAVNLPILREAIGQYINLIKKITHQTTNKKMEQDIQKIISNNLEEAKIIKDNYDQTINKLIQNQLEVLKKCLIKIGFSENQISSEKCSRNDSVFITLKRFEDVELGINVELNSNYFFFALLINQKRSTHENHSEKYLNIRELLIREINDNLSEYNHWTIGKSDTFTIGIDTSNYYYPTADNSSTYYDLGKRIMEFQKKIS